MNTELENFLHRNGACADMIARLEALGAETLEDAWDKAEPEDLVWIVTRPGVMDAEQRRKFLVMVLESIEDKLTDKRSKNILDKLRTKEPITKAYAAAWAADAAWAAARAAEAAWAARPAAEAAADAARASEAAAREKQARWIRTNFRLAHKLELFDANTVVPCQFCPARGHCASDVRSKSCRETFEEWAETESKDETARSV